MEFMYNLKIMMDILYLCTISRYKLRAENGSKTSVFGTFPIHHVIVPLLTLFQRHLRYIRAY